MAHATNLTEFEAALALADPDVHGDVCGSRGHGLMVRFYSLPGDFKYWAGMIPGTHLPRCGRNSPLPRSAA